MTAQERKHLLFVCIENANRSQMAEAFARRHGGERVEAHSAGSRASGRINPQAAEALRELGYDMEAQGHRSKSLEEIAEIEYDVVVGMGCGDACPFVRAKRRVEWDIPDPKHMPPEEFRKVRDLIEHRVKELQETL